MPSVRVAALPFMAACAAGCPPAPAHGPVVGGSASATEDSAQPRDDLTVPYDEAFFASHQKLLDRLRSSPFAYFRYVAAPFAKVVCEEFEADVARMPTVNLHGDLHLEQYAVADDGFGIVDFDDATKGPPLLDWLRVATSVWLATGEETTAEYAIARFIQGYRAGLLDPKVVLDAPEPAVARRIRQRFDTSPHEWLDRVSALILPVDAQKRAKMERARERYVAAMHAQNPDLPAGFFGLKLGGSLKMGVGSAHETKFLVRVEGPSPAPHDDVMLESKQMKHELLGSCVRGEAKDPTRVISAQAKFSRGPQRFLGYVEVDGDSFYVQAWRVHYTEIRATDIKTRDELAEITYDIGLQLGRGHPFHLPDDPHGAAERQAILGALEEAATDLFERSRALAQRSVESWHQFRRASGAR